MGVKQTGTHLSLGSLEKGTDPGSKGGFWPLHCVTTGGMEKRQITRQELVAAALKLGARPGTIRQWFHRGIPYRWQIRFLEHFGCPIEISDWTPNATATIEKPPSLADICRSKFGGFHGQRPPEPALRGDPPGPLANATAPHCIRDLPRPVRRGLRVRPRPPGTNLPPSHAHRTEKRPWPLAKPD